MYPLHNNKFHVSHVNTRFTIVFTQKLPKVNRSLAEKLIDEKKDARKEAVKVSYYNLNLRKRKHVPCFYLVLAEFY